MFRLLLIAPCLAFCIAAAPVRSKELQEYFTSQTEKISTNSLERFDSLEQWQQERPKLKARLFEMLGLDPLPARTDLKPVITGKLEREDFVVEKLYFQSMPGLYVTANLYLPKTITNPIPAILYVCGHALVKTNGVSYGNKVAYQHHGAWFARNGYACLIIDTIELGEIQGTHHGTYREGKWWWNSRGYTPAGVEAWNGMRALDYLETRPEIDKTRFGVTGRSGGGAYSWWITALDDRIQAAAPVAGITDLHNHVIDGTVEGHCDCMFLVNTYRWDYPMVAALAAPRPLLFCNSDKDDIFPLDGVIRTHAQLRHIYELYGASKNLGLLITEGPHKDTQDLQVPVFRWFNRHLKHADPVISMAAVPFFTGQELKVFDKIPEDERTSHIHDSFTAVTPITDRAALRTKLRAESFAGWPAAEPFGARTQSYGKSGGREVRLVRFNSQEHVPLRLYYTAVSNPAELRVRVLTEDEVNGEAGILEQLAHDAKEHAGACSAILLTRGIGERSATKAVQVRRRYMLLGQTLDGMRVWDVLRGIDLLRQNSELSQAPLTLSGDAQNAADCVMAAFLSSRAPAGLELTNVPRNQNEEPDFLNYRRFTTLDDLIQLLAPETKVTEGPPARNGN